MTQCGKATLADGKRVLVVCALGILQAHKMWEESNQNQDRLCTSTLSEFPQNTWE